MATHHNNEKTHNNGKTQQNINKAFVLYNWKSYS